MRWSIVIALGLGLFFSFSSLSLAGFSGRTEVSEEKSGKTSILRIRIFGEAAEKACALLGENLSTKEAGYMNHIKSGQPKTKNQEKTCFRSGSGKNVESGFGFLLFPDQTTKNLEANGYN